MMTLPGVISARSPRPAVVLLLATLVGCTDGPGDFRAAVEELRAAGMTESARGDLSTVAGITSGDMSLTFTTDPVTGLRGRGYGGSCHAPGSEAGARAARERKRHLEVLRTLADRDGSGFVSSDEARALLRAVEFGYAVKAVEGDGEFNRATVAAVAGVTVEEVDALTTTFKETAARPEAEMLRLPAVRPAS